MFKTNCIIATSLLFFVLYGPTALGQNVWEKEIQKFEQQDQVEMPAPGGILFVGSSSIRGWRSVAEDYPGRHVINRGFGGSEIGDVLHFFDRVILRYQPRQVVLYAGDNDIASGKSAETVFGNFQKLVGKFEEELPDTELIFLSIKPSTARWEMYPQMSKVNSMVEELAQRKENVTYVDVSSAMLNQEGVPNESYLLGDGLHMTQEGYELWARILEPYLIKE